MPPWKWIQEYFHSTDWLDQSSPTDFDVWFERSYFLYGLTNADYRQLKDILHRQAVWFFEPPLLIDGYIVVDGVRYKKED